MNGKTHIVSSLTLANLCLVGYTKYINKDIISTDGVVDVTPVESYSLFGFTLGVPISIFSYLLLMLLLTIFVMLLFRVGGKTRSKYYVGFMALLLLIIYISDTSGYTLDLAVILIVFSIGTLLPDIDLSYSTLGKYVPFVGTIIEHRTITHTLWSILIIGGLGVYFESYLLIVLALGHTLHIVQDAFSLSGVMWFYPIGQNKNKKRSVIPRYRVGGTAEDIMFYTSLGLTALCLGVVLFSGLS